MVEEPKKKDNVGYLVFEEMNKANKTHKQYTDRLPFICGK